MFGRSIYAKVSEFGKRCNEMVSDRDDLEDLKYGLSLYNSKVAVRE